MKIIVIESDALTVVYLYQSGMSQLKLAETIQVENPTSCFVRLWNLVSNCKGRPHNQNI